MRVGFDDQNGENSAEKCPELMKAQGLHQTDRIFPRIRRVREDLNILYKSWI
jgi:hypothetical protein